MSWVPKDVTDCEQRGLELGGAEREEAVRQAERVGGTDARAGAAVGANPYAVLSPEWYAYRFGHEAETGEPE